MSKHSGEKSAAHQEEARTASPEVQQPTEAVGQEAPAGGAKDGGADELAAAKARAGELEKEVSELKDQYLRKLADYENFRKRMFREKEEAIQFANVGLLVDLVQVLDDFDRAIKSSEAGRDFKTLHDGIQLIERQFYGLLENKYKLKRFESLGQPFDPNRHEALSVEAAGDGSQEEETVIEEYLKGYQLADRVIRTAKVRVRQPSAAAQPAAASQPPTETPIETATDKAEAK